MNEYLSVDMLNELEYSIFEMNKNFFGKYKIKPTYLRNLEVGDSLNSKVLYLNLPLETNEKIDISQGYYRIIMNLDSDNDLRIGYSSYDYKYLRITKEEDYENIYIKYDDEENARANYQMFKLPKFFGKVIGVEDPNKNNNLIYNITIKNDSTLPLEFKRKDWNYLQVLYLQDIIDIENGIEEIAKCFYKPIGYESKNWTSIGEFGIEKGGKGLEQKSISILDFNRWKKNIDLLNQSLKDFFLIWNIYSDVEWDKYSEYEWEVI